MKALLLRDGDLVLSRREYAAVRGTGKIAQDLRGALLEPVGNDRFHLGWGSTIEQFLARIVDETLRSEVEGEVNRVISNYAAIQRDKIEADIAGDDQTRFTTDEILARIRGVTVNTEADSVHVLISLQTVSGEVIVLSEAVN